ncbi:hypothetical protein EDB19DRAFT_1321158 [Suillus lakei]|nr:hypothetical protein EDB19DRAFT_1321158 [Suillus lakei]
MHSITLLPFPVLRSDLLLSSTLRTSPACRSQLCHHQRLKPYVHSPRPIRRPLLIMDVFLSHAFNGTAFPDTSSERATWNEFCLAAPIQMLWDLNSHTRNQTSSIPSRQRYAHLPHTALTLGLYPCISVKVIPHCTVQYRKRNSTCTTHFRWRRTHPSGNLTESSHDTIPTAILKDPQE